jgi:hypothetical protein
MDARSFTKKRKQTPYQDMTMEVSLVIVCAILDRLLPCAMYFTLRC